MAQNMIFNALKKLYQLSALFLLTLILWRPVALAADFSQINLDDSEFLLLDVTLAQKRLLESIEAYQSNEQVLLPVNLIISALGAGVEVDLAKNTLLYTSAGTTIIIELDRNTSSKPLPDGDYYWAKDDFELYLSHSVLAPLLQASFNIQLSRLNMEIKSIGELFPIEKSWQRSNQLRKREAQESKKVLYLADTYQLLTPPTADVSLSIGKQSSSDINGAFSLQSSSDILYHSANISLHKNINNSDITSRVSFTRHQSTPDTPLWGGLNQYSFGDVSSGGSALFSNSSSGLGLRFSRRPKNVSNNFGTQVIEGNATPGWDVELHYNGFLVETKKVPDDGYYVFQDVKTEYGNNHFEVRLFGPFGEEEVRKVNLTIGSNWLPKGEFSYTGYMLDSNKTLLNGVINKAIIDSQQDYGAAIDYSPFNNTHIGTFFQHVGEKTTASTLQESRTYFGTHIQSALNNLVIDLEYVKQQDRGHRLTAQGIGQFPWGQNYNVVLQDQKNFSITANNNFAHNYQASFATGGILPFKRGVGYRAGLTYSGGEEGVDSWLFNSSLSWRFSQLHFSNTLNYQVINADSVQNSLTGNLAISSNIADIRLRATTSYVIEPISYISSINLGASLRGGSNSYHNLYTTYQPKSKVRNKDNWSLGYTYSTTLDRFRLFSNMDVNANDQWAINFGMNFFFDYDAHNNKFIMSSTNASNSGHLNITSYLDRNDNNRRDEGDWLLNDISFAPMPLWRDRATNQFGQVTLSGVPVYNPVTFNATPNIDVATKQPDYTIYTHPGSRVNIELPFTIKTNISGFIEMEGLNGTQALTTGSVILTNHNTDEKKELVIDIDGYYEAPMLNPGHYSIQVATRDLERLKLVAKQGTVNFVTPPQGGEYEIPVILLVTASDNSDISTSTNVTLNEENGEAFYFGEDTTAANMYANPWDPRFSISGNETKTQITGTANYQRDSAQPLTVIAPTASSNDAMAAEAQSGVAAGGDDAMRAEANNSQSLNEMMAQQPSSIASDEAMRAEAAGNFTIANNTEASEPPQPTTSIPAAQSAAFTVQVGAFGSPANAQRWLDSNSAVANDCSVTRTSALNIVNCGAFSSRQDAASYQRFLAQQYNIESTMIKSINRVAPDVNAVISQTTDTRLATTANQSGPVFTIQLLVSAQQRTLETFITRHQLDSNQTLIRDKLVNGRTLKALSFGRYNSKEQAQQAINSLPAQIQQQTWITQL